MFQTPTPFLVSLFILQIKIIKKNNFLYNIMIMVLIMLKKQNNTKKGVGVKALLEVER